MRNESAVEAITILRERPQTPDVIALLRKGDAHMASLYPSESNHMLSPEALSRADIKLLVARDGEGRAVGTGALVSHGVWAEIKRMWVEPNLRGRGISKMMLQMIEAEAVSEGIGALFLETGILSREALKLYDDMGYRKCPPFGDYSEDPLSVFMRKCLMTTSA